ncbi:MAG: hypothetical protein HYR84_11675 [Planctomycetes bacterium]|nr:hypothetical protein [Planctomycetota bacterium]
MVVMLVVFVALAVYLAWNPIGHWMITGFARDRAIADLRAGGSLGSLLLNPADLEGKMVTLPMMDCKEDLTLANMIGLGQEAIEYVAEKGVEAANWLRDHTTHRPHLHVPTAIGYVCGAELVSGGQVAHFMRDEKQTPWQAFWISFEHIRSHCKGAWKCLNIALPLRRGGILGAIINEVQREVQDFREVAFQAGMSDLGAALHTLQDSFSPAHTLRDGSGRFVENVFNWSLDNRHSDPAINWPGHSTLDGWQYNGLTQTRTAEACEASRAVIVTIFEQLHQPEGVFLRAIEGTLFRALGASPALPMSLGGLQDTY